jgi:beta-phosphoglucomutase
MNTVPGLKNLDFFLANGFTEKQQSAGGLFMVGYDGVKHILSPSDEKSDFIVFKDKTLVLVKSELGYPAIYPMYNEEFDAPAEVVLMDLDGTSVKSETFWIEIIQSTMAHLLGNPQFCLEEGDFPFISGHSVSEHLNYCLVKYSPSKTLDHARKIYFEITHHELGEITKGRGKMEAFTPATGLKEFLLSSKEKGLKIGLVTSGLYEKAWPEIVAAFHQMGLKDPLSFYDTIITAGFIVKKGQAGTLGELSPKPHPWLYAETARIGMGIPFTKRHKVIGIEDSAAGVLSLRLAGFAAIGLEDGNIRRGGLSGLTRTMCNSLKEALPLVLEQ